MSNEPLRDFELLSSETRARLKDLSQALLWLHKILLNAAKTDYEIRNGRIESVGHFFQLVLEDQHFAWLRKISRLIALIDEATSIRRPATELQAKDLLTQVEILLNFEDPDEEFNRKLQTELLKNRDAVIGHNTALSLLKK